MKHERNKPCHCNSGKKYKKCCWLTKLEDDRKATIAWNTPPTPRPESSETQTPTVQRRRRGSPLMLASLMAATIGMGGWGATNTNRRF